MQRHMDLIRAILFFAEEQEGPWYEKEIAIDGWGQRGIVDHVGLALEAGFLDGTDARLLGLGPDGKQPRALEAWGLPRVMASLTRTYESDTSWNRMNGVLPVLKVAVSRLTLRKRSIITGLFGVVPLGPALSFYW